LEKYQTSIEEEHKEHFEDLDDDLDGFVSWDEFVETVDEL